MVRTISLRMNPPNVAACFLMTFASWSAAHAGPGLEATGSGELRLDGDPLRAVGVNYFSAFYRTLKDPDDGSYDEGFATLAAHGVPFCRFMACGFWPVDWDLYFSDKEAYFELLDGVVASAERHRVGLIPSLFWAYWTVPDLMGEPVNRLGDPDSDTIAFIRQYASEVVGRYKDSPAIWAWELGNEYSLAIDLPNAEQHRPPTWTSLGCPATRSEEDDLTHEDLVTALTAFGEAVRALDPDRVITTGHSMPRPSQYHQRVELSWTQDSREEYQQSLLDLTPNPLDMASMHYYPQSAPRRFGEEPPPPLSELLQLAREAARQDGKALFLGEFGVSETAYGGDADQIETVFRETLETAEEGADIAAIWVFDLAGQEGEWNITLENGRGWMLDATGQANDTDRDGLTNYDEVTGAAGYATDPYEEDTDGDGYGDKAELDAGTDPTNPHDPDGPPLSLPIAATSALALAAVGAGRA